VPSSTPTRSKPVVAEQPQSARDSAPGAGFARYLLAGEGTASVSVR